MLRRINKKKDLSKIIENALLKISVLGLLSMVFVQFFLSNHSVKTILGNNSNEVISIEESAIYNPQGWIELNISNFNKYKNLVILKNGEEVKKVLSENDIINIPVYDGDVIEVDATDYQEPIHIKVHNFSKNINNLKIGEDFKSNKNIMYLFKIEMDPKNNS
ncbi:hypothetical protein [Garciella nitratireducens]|uniref:Uncharacterized protein n=1 Tax=Garciella nitratireducens DSM 15102 TaxID=1121911 RepID=A0A1T4JV89_9FIRM|nr:hypothetical protein [Garciella nitratireducens]RBP45597.1 hypothetical protein DFR81_102134 [Garciella nitratireducens]SJZ34086.1 hypothetical protein SAMN02745973_00120 [Garciella nitratireducens DSM 15102]